MNALLASQYARMKAAGKHADVCLILTQDGYVCMGKDAEKVKGYKPNTVGEIRVPPPDIPPLVSRLRAAGYSVALLDWWSPDLSVKPQPVLVYRFEGEKEEWV